MAALSRVQEKLLRRLATRQGRRKLPYFICEGERCCAEALGRRPDWVEFIMIAEDYSGTLATGAQVCVAPGIFNELAQTENPQGILAVLRRPETAFDQVADPLILVLDRLADPGNVGTLLRTAWAFGLKAVILTHGSCDPYGPKAVRAGMGAQLALDLPIVDDLETIIRHWTDRRVWIADVRAGVACYESAFDPHNAILVLGNEAGGTVHAGAARVHIPMPGKAESLNVAQAGTILLYEASRRSRLS